MPIEAAEIGEVDGKRVVHLQCHIGLDTLALARRGAAVAGVDFSGNAIAAARALAAESGLAAHFVEANVYDAVAETEGPFDIVYTTWGTIGWLPDIRRWADVVAGLLVPGGFLYFADHHPILTGLQLSFLREHECIPWQAFPMIVPAGRGMYRLPDGHAGLPLAFSLKAVRG